MNKWSPERAEAIRQFIDEYFMENRKSPTVRDIAAGTGISKTSVQRYLTDMKEHGEIEYNGRRSIGTNLSRNMFETTPAIHTILPSPVGCRVNRTWKKRTSFLSPRHLLEKEGFSFLRRKVIR